MISTTCHVASHVAITGILSVCFFREAVVRPALSGCDGKISAGRVVASTCMSTLILVVAAHRTASKILSGEIGMPSTGGNPTDTVPTAADCPACVRYKDTPSCRSLGKSVLLGPFQRPFLSFLSFHSTSSSPVLDSPPCDITITDLPISSSPVSEPAPNITITDLPISSARVPESTMPSDITTINLPIPSSPVLPSTPADITTIDLHIPSSPVLPSTLADITMIESSTSSTHVSPSTPSDITTIDLSTSSTHEFPPTPHNITIIDLPDLANCHRLSLTSDTTLVAGDDDDDLKDVFADEASNTKEVESSDDERTFHEVRIKDLESSGDKHIHHKDHSATTTNPIDNAPSRLHNLGPLALVDKFRTTTSTITNPSLHVSAHLPDTNTSRTGSLRPANANASLTGSAHPANASLTGSAHRTNVLAQKTKAAASWLKPLILVTKHAAGRLIPPHPTALQYQPEKSRPHKLKQQKRKPRASRSNAACNSIVRSRLRRHTNRIVGHLAQVCEQIHTDQAAFMDVWVTAMAEVGLTSILAGNHRTSLASPFPPIVDAALVPEPGSRIKARLASLRQRTNAVAATIPATTTTAPSLPRRHTSWHHQHLVPPRQYSLRRQEPPPSNNNTLR